MLHQEIPLPSTRSKYQNHIDRFGHRLEKETQKRNEPSKTLLFCRTNTDVDNMFKKVKIWKPSGEANNRPRYLKILLKNHFTSRRKLRVSLSAKICGLKTVFFRDLSPT